MLGKVLVAIGFAPEATLIIDTLNTNKVLGFVKRLFNIILKMLIIIQVSINNIDYILVIFFDWEANLVNRVWFIISLRFKASAGFKLAAAEWKW